MHRRAFAIGVAFTVLAAPSSGRGQSAGRVHRLAILSPSTQSAERGAAASRIPAALRHLGYVEGQNLVLERRSAEGQLNRLPGLARELVQLRPDVILGIGPDAVRAAREVAGRIPIVMFAAVDPVAQGWVASLARPGGTLTGVVIAPDSRLAGKRLQLLREAVPRATRIAVLSTSEPQSSAESRMIQEAARGLDVVVLPVEVKGADYGAAFAQIVTGRAEALIVVASSILNLDRQQIMDLSAKHRLPAIYQWRVHVEEGGLMSYGSDIEALSQRAATHIDRIFKGAAAGELPIEQPNIYEMAINLKTARALGLTVPPGLLGRADRVVE